MLHHDCWQMVYPSQAILEVESRSRFDCLTFDNDGMPRERSSTLAPRHYTFLAIPQLGMWAAAVV